MFIEELQIEVAKLVIENATMDDTITQLKEQVKQMEAPVLPDDVAQIINRLSGKLKDDDYHSVVFDVPVYWRDLKEAIDLLERQQREISVLESQATHKDTELMLHEGRIAELDRLLRKAAEGTWWDGNESFTIQRLESWIAAALQENNYE